MRRQIWETEPSSLDFESDGLPCAMRRNWTGCWCGYVGVGPDHPWFGLPFNALIKPTPDMLTDRAPDDHGVIDLLFAAISKKDIEKEMPISLALRAHGGITFAADTPPDGITLGSDGPPVPGKAPEGFWWFGFDCGHAGDFTPLSMFRLLTGGVYRDQQYVVSECQQLATQLVKIKQAALAKEATL